MCEHLIEFESETITYEDATVTLHKIKSDNNFSAPSPLHTHRYYELLLVVDGTHTCHMESGDISLQAGELLIISPTVHHRILCSAPAPNIAVLGIEVSAPHGKGRFFDYFHCFLQANAGKPLHLRNSVFHKMVHYYLAPTRRSIRQICERKREACDILSELWAMADKAEHTVNVSPSTAPDIILETLVFSKNVPLSEIAERLGYSTRQVQRLIRARYGKSLRRLRSEKE